MELFNQLSHVLYSHVQYSESQWQNNRIIQQLFYLFISSIRLIDHRSTAKILPHVNALRNIYQFYFRKRYLDP